MKQIKLVDLSFYGDNSSSKLQPSKNISWDRTHGPGPVVFFTDLCLQYVDLSCYKNSLKICWLIEPISINQEPYKYIVQNHHKFDLILTHFKDLIKINPNKFYWYPFGGCWIPEKDRKVWPKSKSISIIASSKAFTEGHNLRHEIINKFKNKIDVYGYGYNPIDNKADGLRDYRFSVAVENAKIDLYMTEKWTDCLCTGTIPIYFGPTKEDMSKFFNVDGALFFNNLEELEQILIYIEKDGEHIYNSKIKAVEENFELVKDYLCSEEWIYINILTKLNII